MQFVAKRRDQHDPLLAGSAWADAVAGWQIQLLRGLQRLDETLIVGDDDQGAGVGVQNLQEVRAQAQIQVVAGFVQQQHIRPCVQRTCQGVAHLFAATARRAIQHVLWHVGNRCAVAPALGIACPASMLSRLLLPVPLLPIRATRAPAGRRRSTPLKSARPL